MADANLSLIYLDALFTTWLYYVPAPLVLSVILQLQLKRDSGAIGASAIAARQWDNELRWAPCTFLSLKF